LQLIRGETKLVDACREHDLKQSEVDAWMETFVAAGERGLKARSESPPSSNFSHRKIPLHASSSGGAISMTGSEGGSRHPARLLEPPAWARGLQRLRLLAPVVLAATALPARAHLTRLLAFEANPGQVAAVQLVAPGATYTTFLTSTEAVPPLGDGRASSGRRPVAADSALDSEGRNVANPGNPGAAEGGSSTSRPACSCTWCPARFARPLRTVPGGAPGAEVVDGASSRNNSLPSWDSRY